MATTDVRVTGVVELQRLEAAYKEWTENYRQALRRRMLATQSVVEASADVANCELELRNIALMMDLALCGSVKAVA
jgi:hypothetical protein